MAAPVRRPALSKARGPKPVLLPPAKRVRVQPSHNPEDIIKGMAVEYAPKSGAPGGRGIVRDAYVPIDEFWVADEATGELVRAEDTGDVISFCSKELRPEVPVAKPESSSIMARVLLIGKENHMVSMLEHFGAPDLDERQEIQQLLAIPCNACRCARDKCEKFSPNRREMCDAECPLKQAAEEGVDWTMRDLAQKLRPDLHIGVRPFHLLQAIEKLGTLETLADYFVMASVTLPYPADDYMQCEGYERYVKERCANQIDVGVTAQGEWDADEVNDPDAGWNTARRVLGESCGVYLSDGIWAEEAQWSLRRELEIDFPVQLWDGPDTVFFTILIPEDATWRVEDGMLEFLEAAPTWEAKEAEPYDIAATQYESSSASSAKVLHEAEKPQNAQGRESKASTVSQVSQVAVEGHESKASTDSGNARTIAEWKKCQDEFKHLPSLPANWIRIRSRKNNNEIYFLNTKTMESAYDMPVELPPGWSREKSSTTGKLYFFNAKTGESTYEQPLPEGWTKHISKSSGQVYYWHERTQWSQFVKPTKPR